MGPRFGHTPVLFLYFSFLEPSQEGACLRICDLLSGNEIGHLHGHMGTVKALQVEVHLCTTGATNGSVRLWNLRRVGGKGETSDCRFLWIRIGQLEDKWN